MIWELPNLFLNVQRRLDGAGNRMTLIRAVNRVFLLSTYAIFRLGFGTITLFQMTSDMVTTLGNAHPIIRAEYIVPSLLHSTHGVYQEVRRPPWFLALIQLGSMGFLHVQGFYWFARIMRKGDLATKRI
jgi:hypothetical protein